MNRSDQSRIDAAYALLHEALNEICMVREKDASLTRVQRQLYTIEDTLYQYRTKEARKID